MGTHLIARDGRQPRSKTADRLLTFEPVNPTGHRDEHLLDDIRTVIRTQSRTAAPAIDDAAERVDQTPPRSSFHLLDTTQQRGRGGRVLAWPRIIGGCMVRSRRIVGIHDWHRNRSALAHEHEADGSLAL